MAVISRLRGYSAGWLSDERRRRGIRVFCYHGVVERKVDERIERNQVLLSDFQAQIDFLRRFRVLDLDGLLEELQTPSRRRRPGIMVTFDDACANSLLAAEVLARRRVPWTMFVPVGEIETGRALWPVDLSLLLLYGRARRVEVLGRRWTLSSRDAREATFQTLRYELKSLPAAEREATMTCIRKQFPVDESALLVERFPSFRMLSWTEIASLATSGCEIGSHGQFHELHHSRQPESVRRRELTESKIEIESRLKRECRSFAYPNGDFVDSSPAEARVAGYRIAFTTWPGTVTAESDPYLLSRLHPSSSLTRFARDFWWTSDGDSHGKLPKISVEQREADLQERVRSGTASPGVLLQHANRVPEAKNPDVEYANPPKLARVVAILDAIAQTRLREPKMVHLGCGSGWLTAILGGFGPTLGVGFDEESVGMARKAYSHVSFLQADLERWDYPHEAFDIVISHQMVERVNDPGRYIDTALGLLRPGGFLVVTTANARTIEAIPSEKRPRDPDIAPGALFSLSDLKNLLTPRFQVVRLTTIVPRYGSLGIYRLVNSGRVESLLTDAGLGPLFERWRLSHGYGLHLLALARKA